MEEPASPDFPRIRPPAARRGGGKGVRARPGTLIHPYLDKIFTKWVAIKDLDASQTRNLTRISVRIFLEGPRVHISTFFSLFLDLNIWKLAIFGPEKKRRRPRPSAMGSLENPKYFNLNNLFEISPNGALNRGVFKILIYSKWP